MKWLGLHFIFYQVNNAWTLNHTNSQWVDLGIHTEACMTRPETCGAAGGAISLWLNVIDCSPGDGIISSYDYLRTGLIVFCYSENIRYDTHVLHSAGTSVNILQHTQMTNTFDTKIILHNYISYKRQPSYIGNFPVYLRMPLIFTDFPTGSGS